MSEALTPEEIATNEKTQEHIDEVRHLLVLMCKEINERAMIHDRSKLERPEVATFTEYTPKLAGCTYGSEEYKGYLNAMYPALQHHYFNNRHHPEFFAMDTTGTLYGPDLDSGKAVSRMNILDVLEMFCDWAAACKRHNDGDIKESIKINTKRFGLSEQLASILTNSVPLLEDR